MLFHAFVFPLLLLNAFAPIKEEITIDEFDKVDMRVCKVINCEIVKNAKKLLKLTLFD